MRALALFVEKGAAVQLFSLPNQAPAARRLIQAQRVLYANKLDIANFQVKWVNGVYTAHSLWLRFNSNNMPNFSTGKNAANVLLIDLGNRQMEILATFNFSATLHMYAKLLGLHYMYSGFSIKTGFNTSYFNGIYKIAYHIG